MDNRGKTNGMVEASLISALIFIIVIISAYVPILSTVGLFVLPIPVTILYIRHGFKFSILSVIVSFLLTAMLYSIFPAIVMAISYGLIGIVFGYCIKKGRKALFTNILLTITNIIANIFKILIYTVFIDKKSFIDQLTFLVNTYKETFQVSKGVLEKMGTLSTQQLEVFEQMENMLSVQMFLTIIPAALILGAIVQSIINYKLTGVVLRKLKINKLEDIKPFDELYLSNLFTAGILILWSAGVLLNYIGFSFGSYLSSTVLYLMLFIFVINGISAFIYYLRNKRKIKAGKWLIVLILIFAFTSQFILNIFFFLGLLDSIMDLRRLDPYSFRKNKKGGKNE